jgi:hypothetical protein
VCEFGYRKTIKENGCHMNLSKSPIATLLIIAISLSPFISLTGCSGNAKTVTPQQKEEQRQKMIKNAERQRREG